MTTNYLVFGLRPRSGQDPLQARTAFMAEVEQRGVAYIDYGAGRIRALTHYGIDGDDIEHTLAVTRDALVASGLAPIRA